MKWCMFVFLATACIETTGGQVVSFHAQAVGTVEASQFQTPRGYQVTLSRAQLWVGAIYLNQNNPQNYTAETSCVLPGIYSGEVRGGLMVDALSATPQNFPVLGNGTDRPVKAGELWLTYGDINEENSDEPVLQVQGTASKDAQTWPFSGTFTIGRNRKLPPRDPALPGSRPICKERIISPIPTELTLSEGGTLVLQVDPRAWFASVEFSELSSGTFVDSYEKAGQPDRALFDAMKAVKGPYLFSWKL